MDFLVKGHQGLDVSHEFIYKNENIARSSGQQPSGETGEASGFIRGARPQQVQQIRFLLLFLRVTQHLHLNQSGINRQDKYIE